jgi:cell volume regulation protein A
MRRVSLPGEGLYALRTMACAALLYGLSTIAHGSGFLAVFLAGIVIGDERAPYKHEIERFHSALAGLAEIVAFVVLGLTVDVDVVLQRHVLLTGLALAVVVAFVVRPLFVGLCLLPARLPQNETAFILFAGLKGAVPLLLGELMLAAHVDQADRLYGMVVIVVVFSVLVQGSLTPAAAHLLHVPMLPVEPEPWALSVPSATWMSCPSKRGSASSCATRTWSRSATTPNCTPATKCSSSAIKRAPTHYGGSSKAPDSNLVASAGANVLGG